MEKFKTLLSTAVPLPIENVDTDQIIPARFLKATSKVGFGKNLFCDWRFDKQGSIKEDFILNNSSYTGKILVAGENFGCGSSREADIFKGNALNNGLLPIQISKQKLDSLLDFLKENPKAELKVDLENQVLVLDAIQLNETFEIDPYKKMCLLNGYDDIDFLISKEKTIKEFESQLI